VSFQLVLENLRVKNE